MSACEFCGVDHDAEDAAADARSEIASLRERAEKAEAQAAALAGALAHMEHCSDCALGDWEDCDGGRAALAALRAYQGEDRHG